jgi:hypothetical protein
MEMIKAVEDRLLENSLNIVEGLMGFADIGLDEHGNVDDSQIPDHWHDLPKEERDRKIRLAKFGMLNSSDIPHGAKLSHATAIGIIKARAQAETGTRILNIESATFPSPAPITTTYEVLDIED